jgi:hypothetical protein
MGGQWVAMRVLTQRDSDLDIVEINAALSRWPSTRVYAWTFLVQSAEDAQAQPFSAGRPTPPTAKVR